MNKQQLDKINLDVGTSVVATQMSLHYLEKLKYYPQLYKGQLKRYGNLYLKELLKSEKNSFDLADKDAEESTEITCAQYMECIDYISKGNLVDLFNLVMLNEAYRLDPDSMTGIAKKILKNKK